MAMLFSTSILERRSLDGAGRSSIASSSVCPDPDNDTLVFEDISLLMRPSSRLREDLSEATSADAAPSLSADDSRDVSAAAANLQPPAATPVSPTAPPSLSSMLEAAAKHRICQRSTSVLPLFMDKENRLPAPVRDVSATKMIASSWTQLREVDQLKKQLVHEEKLRNQAEAQITEHRKFRRSVHEVQQQLHSQNSNIEVLERRCDELETLRREAQNRARDHATALDKAQSALDRKQQEVASLQQDLEGARQQVREHGQQAEEANRRVERLALHLEDQRAQVRLAAPQKRAALAEMVASLQASLAKSTNELWEELERLGRNAQLNKARMEELRAQRSEGRMSEADARVEACRLVHASTIRAILADCMSEPGPEICDASTQAFPVDGPILKDDDALHESRVRDTEECLSSVLAELHAARASVKELTVACETLRAQVEEARSETSDERFFASCLEEAIDKQSVEQQRATEGKSQLEADLARAVAELEQAVADKATLLEASVRQRSEMLEAKNDRARLEVQVYDLIAEVAQLKHESATLRQAQSDAMESAEPGNEAENQDLLAQNRELSMTMQLFKQECEFLHAENRGLRESAAAFEQSFDRVTSENAKLMGHSNHRQKIHYTLRLKEENGKLRDELRKSQQKVLQLQQNKLGQDLVVALAPFAVEAAPKQRSRSATGASAMSAGASGGSGSPTKAMSSRASRRSLRAAPEDAPELQPLRFEIHQRRADEFERRCRAQERTLERLSLDFRHFTALIERAVAGGGSQHSIGSPTDAAALLEQLRCAVAKQAPAPVVPGQEAFEST